MKFLLDANAVIGLIKLDRTLVAKVNRRRPNDFVTSAVVLYELYFGAFKSSRLAENLKTVGDVGLEVLAFDRADAQRAGEIRHRLTAEGMLIGPSDILIAGQALARNLTLISRNVREFSRVEGLRVEDWQA